MTIYLVQHGKAKSKQEDPERPLNNSGIAESNTVLHFLKKQGLQPIKSRVKPETTVFHL